ncbi:MAG: sulfotransferase [Thiogranum sp.]
MSPRETSIEQQKNLARKRMMENRLDEAKALYQDACRKAPDDAESLFSLGSIHLGEGRFAEAGHCLSQAVRLSPSTPQIHHALGVCMYQQRRLTEAMDCFHKALELQPDFADARYALANTLCETGQLPEAETAYRQLLALNPLHVAGLNNLGTLLLHLGRFDEAIEQVKKALEQQPDSVETLTNLANACIAKGALEPAIEYLQRALTLRPDFFDACYSLGNAYHFAGRLKEALQAYSMAAEFRPDNDKVAISRAMVLKKLSRFDEAWSLLEHLVQQGNRNAVLPYFDISHQLGQRDTAVQKVKALLDKSGMSETFRASLHYRMGKHREEYGEYARAFHHYQQANRMDGKSFDLDAFREQIAAIIDTYNRDFIESMPRATGDSDRAVFIIGMPRSGTSLVEQIISAHPGAFGAGELPHIFDACAGLSARLSQGRPFPAFVSELQTEMLDSIAARYLDRIAELAGDEHRVTDKMPHNFMYLGFIAQLFPNTRVIHCVRNPMDNCLSCYFSQFGTLGHAYAGDLETLGNYYVEYHRLMKHWMQVLDIPCLEVAYENLVHDQEVITRRLLEHCRLDWDPACLDFHQSDRTVVTLSNQQVRQRLYTSSIGRWKNFEEYIDALRAPLDKAGILENISM